MGLELVLGVCLCVLLWAVLCPLCSISNKRRAGQGVLWQVTMWGVPKNHFLQKIFVLQDAPSPVEGQRLCPLGGCNGSLG